MWMRMLWTLTEHLLYRAPRNLYETSVYTTCKLNVTWHHPAKLYYALLYIKQHPYLFVPLPYPPSAPLSHLSSPVNTYLELRPQATHPMRLASHTGTPSMQKRHTADRPQRGAGLRRNT